MIAQEYRIKNNELMEKWEKECREWLKDKGKDSYLVENIPFFKDGVVCPEVWFEKGNTFRPLVILKEVSLGINTVKKLPDFSKTWCGKTFFEFAECPFDDIRVGTFSQWRRIARLVKGFEEVHYYDSCEKYKKCDLGFKDGGVEYTGEIPGYKTDTYHKRTANSVYNSIVDRIAVLELKKVGGGTNVNSALSLATEHYFEHVGKFRNNIYEQIKLINPTLIICLGREYGDFVGKNQILSCLRKQIVSENGIVWIDGWHHSRSSNINFYENPLKEYSEYIEKKVK